MLFIEETSPPPFWQPQLTDKQRLMYDKAFIGQRSQAYYLKRFAEFDKAGYLSPKWHWAGFVMTFPWLLYRQRFLDSIVYTVAGWSFIHLNITLALVLSEFLFMSMVDADWRFTVRLSIAGTVWLFWACMVARWCDAYYYRMARREIADAIEMYPNDEAQQLAHIRQHGGVSMVGMGLAFGFYGFMLMLLKFQFLPLYAKKQSNQVIDFVYHSVYRAKERVEIIYQQTNRCPVGMPLTVGNQQLTFHVLAQAEGIPSQSHCLVQATVKDVKFPNRWLNGQKITMYRLENGRWGCVSSLNQKQKPKQCFEVD